MSRDPRDSLNKTDARAALEAAYRHALAFDDARATRAPNAAANFDALMRAFGGPVPEAGSPADDVIEWLVAAAEPGLMGTAGPRFFGWVVGGSHPVGVAADWLTATWGQNVGNHHASPAGAAAETVAEKWL